MSNKILKYEALLILVLLIYSCGIKKNTARLYSQMNYIGMYEIPFDETFLNTKIGGLSGIDYNLEKDVYYLISDDPSTNSPSRYYTVKIHSNNKMIDSITFLDVNFLKNKNGNNFINPKQSPLKSIDPEDLRYNPKDKYIYWSNEGERLVQGSKSILQNPSINIMDLKGNFIGEFLIPSNLVMQELDKGPRKNGALEGVAFSKDYNYLYTSLEVPLFEDGEPSTFKEGGKVRIYKFKTKTKKAIYQYGYTLDPVAFKAIPKGTFQINGISAIIEFKKDKLLVVERSYSNGRKSSTIKIFIADLSEANDVSSFISLNRKQNYRKVSKDLLLNLDTLGIHIDNIEGITFGPNLPNGNKTLLLVADNNFSKNQKSQILFFELIE